MFVIPDCYANAVCIGVGGHYKVGPGYCRSASRVELQPDIRPTDYMGYRLVLRLQEQ